MTLSTSAPNAAAPRLLDAGFNLTLRPMRYPRFYDMYRDAIRNTWTVEEVDFSLDVNDLRNKFGPAERHLIERLVAVSDKDWITDEDLPYELHVAKLDTQDQASTENLLERALSTFERNFIVRALEKSSWNVTATSRALGIPLTPKAARYLEKRPYGPGEHGRTRRRADSDYAVRLREKQRLRAQYGIREKQLRIAFEEARRTQGLTGENLVELLEMRLDALVLRAGFARTITQARQFVVHRHILVDGKIVDRPSFRVKPGQLIHVKERSEGTEPFQVAAAGGHAEVLPPVPGYLEVELDKLHARLVRRPKRAEVPVTAEVQLVVEYYAAR